MKHYLLVLSFALLLPSLTNAINIERVCLNNGEVTIYWSKLNDTCSDFKDYNIYWRQSSSDNFSQLFTVGDYNVTSITQEPDDIGNFDQWEYYVVGDYECGGSSQSEYSDTIQIDSQTPDPIPLDSISVVNGVVVLGWSQHPDQDIKGYNIYYIDPDDNNTRRLDTVEGKDNTLYVDDSLSNPENGAENFSLGAFDSCNNGSPISNERHSTIYLSIDADSCEGRAELSWTAYQGWDVAYYKVLLKDPDGNVKELGQKEPGDLTYSLTSEDVESDVEYDVFVRAIKEGENTVTSSSNQVIFSNNIIGEPDYVYLRNVTVVDSSVMLNWVSSGAEDVGSYEIYRSQSRNSFTKIGTVNASGESEYSGEFIDSTVLTSETEYYYQVRAIDICGQLVENSNISNTIFLRVRNPQERSILRWNLYEYWEGGVDRYQIQRSVDPGSQENWKRLDSVSFNQLEYVDTNPIEEEPEDGICYRIVAVEGGENDITTSARSRSNVVCFYEEAVVHVPNAFRPEGETNTHFRPMGLFIDYERSEMYIYSRWGQEIFHSEGIDKGWDGTNANTGDLAQVGVYMYMIRLIGKDGQTETVKGTVQLLR